MADVYDENEAARLAALSETGLLDELPQRSLDRYTKIASMSIGAPVALVSLVDDRRQFFSSLSGLPEPWATQRETPLTHSFCKLVVASRDKLIVQDARTDARVSSNLAIRDLGVIAYAGTPIRTPESYVLGSFCVIDDKPREWTAHELALLDEIGAAVNDEIELRRRAHRVLKSEQALSVLNQELFDAKEISLLANRQAVHDLRTPLNVMVLGTTQLLKHEGIRAFPEVARMLDRLIRNSNHATSLVGQLEAQRTSSSPPAPSSADVTAIVTHVARDLSTSSQPIEVTGTSSSLLNVEPSALRRSLENLITNALRFATSRVHVVIEPIGSMVALHVEDDGPGLPSAEAYASVWTRDVRHHLQSGRSGSGLGLSIVKEVTERVGGRVHAETGSLGGARFTMMLPVA
ncbi:MAG TPA: GAF domain-containing sensor histidine kinase [Polyangiales bacterium]|nr:GAF domain-containing sensor histidine kinase [Polyangiales bacterium]